MTLIELMMALGITTMMSFVLFGAIFSSSRVARNIDSGMGTFGRARTAFESIASDIAVSDTVLAQYPVASPAFTTNGTNTLILRRPFVDASGNVVAGRFTVVIYHLRALVGINGPFELRRLTASINGATQSNPVQERVLCNNIRSLALSYVAVDRMQGNGSQRDFTLRGTPVTGAQPLVVMVGGVDRLKDGEAERNGNTITFDFPPRWGVAIDSLYSVNPSTMVNVSGANAANFVNWTVEVEIPSRSERQVVTERVMTISSRAQVRNL